MFLAAAVSDFYVPLDKMVRDSSSASARLTIGQASHKIQSCDGLHLELENVPKMLKALSCSWCPKAFLVSFKLETDAEMLMKKIRKSLSSYHQHWVVGNLLQTRFSRVTLVSPHDQVVELKREEDNDLNTQIVKFLSQQHDSFILKP
jgi:phosphopantothenate-cysteine ligase